MASRSWLTSGAGMNSVAWRLPRVMVPVLSSSSVFTSPAASTARPLMASTLYCTSRSMPAMPMAESSPPMVVGIRQTSSETSTKMVCGAFEYIANGCSVTTASRKMMVRPESRMLSAISLGVFWRDGALDQRDHAVEKGLAGIGGDADFDPVRQHLGAAGHGRAVAAGLADHGSRLAGNRRLVHRSHAFDHFAVAGDVVVGFDIDHVSGAKQAAGDLFKAAVGGVALGNRLALGLAQRVGLGLAAALGHGLGKVGEQHREPQPERDLQVEAKAGRGDGRCCR